MTLFRVVALSRQTRDVIKNANLKLAKYIQVRY